MVLRDEVVRRPKDDSELVRDCDGLSFQHVVHVCSSHFLNFLDGSLVLCSRVVPKKDHHFTTNRARVSSALALHADPHVEGSAACLLGSIVPGDHVFSVVEHTYVCVLLGSVLVREREFHREGVAVLVHVNGGHDFP